MIVFLVILSLTSAFFYGFGVKALPPILITAITTVLLDLFIGYFKSKKSGMRVSSFHSLTTHFFSKSALISGLFIGGLLTQNLQWHIYILAGIIAVLSKYLIKFQQKQIFNPANFGVLIVSISFGAAHTWWISSPIILMLAFGIFVIWRMRRFDLAISFLASYFLINFVIALSKNTAISEIYLNMINNGAIYFFSMFMLIDPKTHPKERKQRIVYGILVAVLLIIFQIYIPKHDLPLALAVGNIFVPLLNKFKN